MDCATITDVTPVFAALETWIKQRPGVDANSYFSPYDRGEQLWQGIRAYRQEIRDIGRDRTRALKALDEARGLWPPKPEILADSFSAFSGRLEWKLGEVSLGSRYAMQPGQPGHLEYCTGQYFPTEFRKAAAAVLERYISSWRQWYARENPPTFTYRTMGDVEAANRAIGGHWFDRDTMRFFKTRVESGLVACGFEGEGQNCKPTRGRFITSDRFDENSPRLFSIREVQPDGSIDTIGKFQGYATRDKARAALLK